MVRARLMTIDGSAGPDLPEVLSLPEGPRRTAAIAAWVQSLFSEETR